MPEDKIFREQELRELSESILTHFPDKSVRWLLEDKENVRGLIEILASELVNLIDFNQLEVQNTSFLSSKLREQVSDLIFSVPFKNSTETDELLIYILIEHQSTVDVSMGFRLLFYMMHIWDSQRQRWLEDRVPKSEWRLRPILPIVFYSGDRRWQVPLSVTAIMDIPDVLSRFVPDFDTLFLNVKEIEATELIKTGHPFGWLLTVLQREKADKDKIIEVLTEAIAYLNTLEPEASERRKRALHYFVMLIASRRPSAEHSELIDLVNQHSDEEEVKIMAKSMLDVTLEKGIKKGKAEGKAEGIEQGIEQGKAEGIEQGKAEGIEQGKAEGKAEGIEQGETQAKRDNVIKLLTYQYPDVSDAVIEAIHEIQERSHLDTLFDQILSATSFDDIDWNGVCS